MRKTYPGQYLLLTLIAAVVLGPLIIMFFTSLKGDEFQILKDLGSFRAFWVDDPSLANFREILTNPNLPVLHFLFNTVLIVVSIVFLGIFVNSLCAYALARMNFKGKGLIIGLIISLIIIPLESLAVPMLLMVNKLGWIDSYHVQIIPFIAHPFSIFLFYQFFLKVPKSLDEAAYIDGAGFFQIYLRVILPLSLPVISTVAILQSLEFWNSFLWPIMVTRGVEYRPLSVGMAQFFTIDPKSWGDIMAFSIVTSAPILFVYLVFQKMFVSSVIGSAVKG